MKNDVVLQNGIVIPDHEIEITTSRSGGPGGQHVNKTDTRITVRWNIKNTTVLTEEQKERIAQKLQSQLTTEGDLIVHNSESRSQLHNKKKALLQLAHELDKALSVPKKRRPTRVSKAAKESRLKTKSHRSIIKKTRSNRLDHD
jgi:ribosome-associated protein